MVDGGQVIIDGCVNFICITVFYALRKIDVHCIHRIMLPRRALSLAGGGSYDALTSSSIQPIMVDKMVVRVAPFFHAKR